MDIVSKILEGLKDLPKGMHISVGIGLMIGIIWWSGAGKDVIGLFSDNSKYKWESIITDTIRTTERFWQDSLKNRDRYHWRMRSDMRDYIDSLERRMQQLEWENNHQ